MTQLSPEMHPMLHLDVIQLLNAENIYTLVDFLREDEDRLMKFMNIADVHQISAIKNVLKANYGMQAVDYLTFCEKLTENRPIQLPTHIKLLDELLAGGLMTNSLIDICGPPDAGKTQLCTSIAVNLAQYNQAETLWIDTKADFSARRIYKILKNRNCSDLEIKTIMQRIRVDTCDDPNKLIEMVEKLTKNFENYKKAKLLVIDSLPALWFLFHGEHRRLGSIAMEKLANNLRKLAVECGMVVLTVNIATRYTSFDSGTNENKVSDLDTKLSQEALVPALGKFWQSICSTRLLVSRAENADSLSARISSSGTTNSIDLSLRTIRIIKCNQLKTGNQCTVNISDSGIR